MSAVTIENENSFQVALSKGLNLFVGAGFSVLAKDTRGAFLPTGSQLSQELMTAFNLPPATGALALPQICAIIEHSKSDDLRDYLAKRFSVGEFDQSYFALDRVSIRTIFTTNIDDLFYKLYASSATSYLNDLDTSGPAFNDRTAIDLVTLHGSVTDQNRSFRFGPEALAAAFASDPDRWHFLTGRLQQYPTLFWGYSVGDAGTLQALSPETVRGRQHKDKWIVLRAGLAEDSTLDLFRALGFQIIQADTQGMLDYLLSVTIEQEHARARGFEKLRQRFPEYMVPTLGSVPVRPIIDFYLGDPPQWSDIFVGNLYHTSHFNQLKDSINAGKDLIMIGVPGCGKTTLLMQLAVEDFSGRHKLVIDSLTREKAQLIVRAVGDQRLLVLIDNFTDSLDGFLELTKE